MPTPSIDAREYRICGIGSEREEGERGERERGGRRREEERKVGEIVRESHPFTWEDGDEEGDGDVDDHCRRITLWVQL